MFDENFSFEIARSPSLQSSTAATRDSSRSVSPCTISGPFPSPRFSVTDLAAQFAEQRIRQDSQIRYDSCDAYANHDDDADWSIPTLDDGSDISLRRSQTFPQRPHSPSRRVHRQITTGLLCTTSHRRDIAALVTRMVEEEEQCSITSAATLPPQPEEDEDEGYNSSDDPMDETSRRSSIATVQSSNAIRRASDLLGRGARVNQKARVRKGKAYRRTAIRHSERA